MGLYAGQPVISLLLLEHLPVTLIPLAEGLCKGMGHQVVALGEEEDVGQVLFVHLKRCLPLYSFCFNSSW